jgi:hypothetical protein
MRLLEVYNMYTVFGRTSPTLLAAGKSCREESRQYDIQCIFFHVSILLIRSSDLAYNILGPEASRGILFVCK